MNRVVIFHHIAAILDTFGIFIFTHGNVFKKNHIKICKKNAFMEPSKPNLQKKTIIAYNYQAETSGLAKQLYTNNKELVGPPSPKVL
jgi:hypothetical protein